MESNRQFVSKNIFLLQKKLPKQNSCFLLLFWGEKSGTFLTPSSLKIKMQTYTWWHLHHTFSLKMSKPFCSPANTCQRLLHNEFYAGGFILDVMCLCILISPIMNIPVYMNKLILQSRTMETEANHRKQTWIEPGGQMLHWLCLFCTYL